VIAPELRGRIDLAPQLWGGIVSYCLVYGPALAAYVIWIRSMELIAGYEDIGAGYGGWRADLLHYSRIAPM
jgi:hypothetical protein